MVARVVVADARPSARQALRQMVERALSWEVVGEAEDGLEAVRLSRQEEADVLLVDTAITGLDLRALNELLGPHSPTLVVGLLDSPHQYVGGLSILKGVPANRIGAIISGELERRRSNGRHVPQAVAG